MANSVIKNPIKSAVKIGTLRNLNDEVQISGYNQIFVRMSQDGYNFSPLYELIQSRNDIMFGHHDWLGLYIISKDSSSITWTSENIIVNSKPSSATIYIDVYVK